MALLFDDSEEEEAFTGFTREEQSQLRRAWGIHDSDEVLLEEMSYHGSNCEESNALE